MCNQAQMNTTVLTDLFIAVTHNIPISTTQKWQISCTTKAVTVKILTIQDNSHGTVDKRSGIRG